MLVCMRWYTKPPVSMPTWGFEGGVPSHISEKSYFIKAKKKPLPFFRAEAELKKTKG